MKKVLKGFVIFVVVLISAYFIYTYFQNKASYVGVVHENANSVVKIGVHNIKETLVLDALTSPNYYYNNNSKNKKEQDNGIEIGYNVFCYSLPTIANTYFTTLKISDSNTFKNFIEQKLEKKAIPIQNAENQKYHFAIIKSLKMALAWNDTKLVIAASLHPSSEKLTKTFTEILVHNKTIKDSDHSLLQTLKNESSHVVYSNGQDIATVNFTDNEAQLKGNIFSNAIVVSPTKSVIEFIPNASLSLQFSTNFNSLFTNENWVEKLGNTAFFSKNNIEASKITARTNGFFSFEISGRTLQKDTVITYDYDDNFEKTEQKIIQENEVPKMFLRLGTEKESLKEYLLEVNTIDANAVFKPLPLYQWYVSENASNTNFSTFKGVAETKQRSSYHLFECNINFEKLQQDVRLSQTQQLFALVDNLIIGIWHFDKNQYNIEGGLKGKKPEVNILTQFYFGLQTNKESNVKEAEL